MKAHSNIALVKYWGKKDAVLRLPQNGSISVTLDKFWTETSVERAEKLSVQLNGREMPEDSQEFERVRKFVDLLPEQNLRIISENNFPTAAGLASSASGFAALAAACNEALQLGLSAKELSILARKGSGSACRSVHGGFVEWVAGDSDESSYAVQLADENHWPSLRIVACITTSLAKKTGSTEAMEKSMQTGAYEKWKVQVEEDLQKMRKAIAQKDFTLLGETAETNCLLMHETAREAGIEFWNEATRAVIAKVKELRGAGVECYFTIDAGPQVKIICEEKDAEKIAEAVRPLVKDTVLLSIGGGI